MNAPPTINYIDFLENAGFELGPTIREQVAAMSVSELGDFREVYLALIDSFKLATRLDPSVVYPSAPLSAIARDKSGMVFTCPDRESGEFRPMLHGRMMQTGDAMLGGDAGCDFDELNLESRLARIKAQLLYAHSIVVSDSLLYINQFFHPEDSNDLREKGRLQLQNYLHLISVLKPLIKREVVIFYPQYEHGGLGFQGHGEFTDHAFEDWFKLQSSNIPRETRLHVEAGYESINELLFFSNRYDASLCLPEKMYEAPLEYLAEFSQAVTRKDKKMDAHIQWHLAHVELPSLAALPLSEVVNIRSDDETFETWRGLLRDAIGQIENVDKVTSKEAVSEVQSILADGQAKIEKSLKKSTALQMAKGPVGAFTLSSLGKLLATGQIDLTAAAATAGLSFLWQYVAGSGKRKAERSLKAHLASFSGMSPTD